MKTPRFALFAFVATLAIGSLVGSAQYSPASAGQFDWLGNKDYVNCLKLMDGMSRGGAVWGSPSRSGVEREAAYDRGRRFCNRKYYPGRPGYDY